MSGMDREGDSPRDAQDIPLHVVSHRVLRSANVQIILGLPLGRKKLFLRRGFPWSPAECPVLREMRGEWAILRATLRFASKYLIPPGKTEWCGLFTAP